MYRVILLIITIIIIIIAYLFKLTNDIWTIANIKENFDPNILRTNLINSMTLYGQITIDPLKDVFTNNELVPKKYVDQAITKNTVPDADSSRKGILKLSGDLSGNADNPIISDKVITLNKFAPLTPNILLGADNSNNITEYNLGDNLVFSNNKLELTDIPLTINGVYPSANGNVPVSIGKVFTGTLSEMNNLIGNSDGDMYVITGDPNSDNNGRSYIFNANTNTWVEVSTALPSGDARYIRLSGINNLNDNSRLLFPDNYNPLTDNDIVTLQNVKKLILESNSNINIDIFLQTNKINEMIDGSKILMPKNDTIIYDNELITKKYVDDKIKELLNIKKYKAIIFPPKRSVSGNILTINEKIFFGDELIVISNSDNMTVNYINNSFEIFVKSDTIIKVTCSPPVIMNTSNALLQFKAYDDIKNEYIDGPKGVMTTPQSVFSNITTVVQFLKITALEAFKFSIRAYGLKSSTTLGSEGYLIIEEI
jgi:hypothetical protein